MGGISSAHGPEPETEVSSHRARLLGTIDGLGQRMTTEALRRAAKPEIRGEPSAGEAPWATAGEHEKALFPSARRPSQ